MIIKAQRGRGTKIHLLLDDEYVITTDYDFWIENFIADGTDINEEEWQELLLKINCRKAFNKCADLLSRRSHSVKELRDKLMRSVDAVSAEKAIEKYSEFGYLDDRKFASELSEHLVNNKNYSENRLKQELYKRGISKEIIFDIISELEIDSETAIINIINKSYLRRLREENGKEKVIAALMRRGFLYSDIKSALYRIENEEKF